MKQTSFFQFGLDFRMAKHTGIGTYLRGLVRGFEQNESFAAGRLALFGAGRDAAAGQSGILFDAPIYSLSEQWQYPGMLSRCQVWHAPHYNVPFFKGRTRLIVTVHDMIHWIYRDRLSAPQRIYAEVMLRRAVTHADHILTVSQHSKADMVRFLGVDPAAITVAHNGVAEDLVPLAQDEAESAFAVLKSKYNVPDSFFLYVGMLKPHKNVLRLLKNYLALRDAGKIKSGLVLIGQGAPQSEEMRLIRDAGDKVLHLPKIEFGDLRLFYNGARALVHPSLYEGFGLTVLEAMACGTPVLTTRRASLPEVGGDAVRYMDGEDDGEMQRLLQEFDQDERLREKMREKGFLRACQFSWEKSARITAEVYEKVLKSA